jgi:hypothetical protein
MGTEAMDGFTIAAILNWYNHVSTDVSKGDNSMNGESNEEFADEIMAARKIAMQAALESDSPLAAQLKELEILASPFFMGLDEDLDDSDICVFP